MVDDSTMVGDSTIFDATVEGVPRFLWFLTKGTYLPHTEIDF